MADWRFAGLPEPDDPETARELGVEQVLSVGRNMPVILGGNVINASLTAFFFLDVVSFWMVAAWYALLVALCAVRYLGLRQHGNARRGRPLRIPSQTITAVTLWTILFGVLWGGFAAYAFPPESLPHQTLGVFVVAGMAAGATASMSAVPAAAMGYIVASLLPITLVVFAQGDRLHIYMGIMGVAYMALLLGAVRTSYLNFLESVKLRVRNSELLHHAEAANRSKSEFLANMSHELRTPLNAVIGFSDVMLSGSFGPLGSDRYKDYARDINRSGHHLLTIINDILDLSKVEAGAMTLSESRCRAPDLVADSVRFVRDRARQAGVEISTDVPDDLPAIYADEVKVKQILTNLLSNAVKFTPAGGAISVDARRAPDGGLDLLVRDTGLGIDDADLQRVMLPFIQVESATTRSRGGTGLGLPLARQLAELHGGRLNLTSTLGVGTTAWLYFPPDRVLAGV